MSDFKRKNKYWVVKIEDVADGLTSLQKGTLLTILSEIDFYRSKKGKTPNEYVVVNQDEPYAEMVWKLIEFSQTHTKDDMKILLANLTSEFF